MLNIHEKVSFNTAVEIATQEIVRNHYTNVIVDTNFGKIFVDVTGVRPYSNDPVGDKQFYYTPWKHAPIDCRTKGYIRDESIEHCVQIPAYSSTMITKMILARAFAHCMLVHLSVITPDADDIMAYIWVTIYQRYTIDVNGLAKRWIKALYPITGHIGMHDKLYPVIVGRINDAKKEINCKIKAINGVHHHDYDADMYWTGSNDVATLEAQFDSLIAELLFKNEMAKIIGDRTDKGIIKRFYNHMVTYLHRFDEQSSVPGCIPVMHEMLKKFVDKNKAVLREQEEEPEKPAEEQAGEQE